MLPCRTAGMNSRCCIVWGPLIRELLHPKDISHLDLEAVSLKKRNKHYLLYAFYCISPKAKQALASREFFGFQQERKKQPVAELTLPRHRFRDDPFKELSTGTQLHNEIEPFGVLRKAKRFKTTWNSRLEHKLVENPPQIATV